MTSARTAIVAILDAIELLDVDPASKIRICTAIKAAAISQGMTWALRDERMAFARDLLRRKVSRATIRDRLIALFGVSRGQAYRIIGSALELSHK